jgi:flagellar protein FlbD
MNTLPVRTTGRARPSRRADTEVHLMVPLTRLNGGVLHLNADLIASVEEFHDTVVTLVDGRCIVVAETAEQVVAELLRYRASVIALADRMVSDAPAANRERRKESFSVVDGGGEGDDDSYAPVVPLRLASSRKA